MDCSLLINWPSISRAIKFLWIFWIPRSSRLELHKIRAARVRAENTSKAVYKLQASTVPEGRTNFDVAVACKGISSWYGPAHASRVYPRYLSFERDLPSPTTTNREGNILRSPSWCVSREESSWTGLHWLQVVMWHSRLRGKTLHRHLKMCGT